MNPWLTESLPTKIFTLCFKIGKVRQRGRTDSLQRDAQSQKDVSSLLLYFNLPSV